MDLDMEPPVSPEENEVETPPHAALPVRPPPPHFAKNRLQGAVVVEYKECMKNHAANMGGHAVDGCGEFMPPIGAHEEKLLICAACGCHRNFHRQEPDTSAISPPFLDFRRHSSPNPRSPRVLFGFADNQAPVTPTAENLAGRKRFRTKFSQEQKDKMYSFSEKIGWKMHRCDESAVESFCREIGVTRGVLKVWMHNNKNMAAKKDHAAVDPAAPA